MSIYDEMRGIASDVFAEFAQGAVAIVRLTPIAGATPDAPGVPTTTETAINATVRPVSTKYVDGSHIVRSDKQVVIPNDGIMPTMKDSIKIDGAVYKIIEIMPRPAAGTPVSFTLIVRK